MNINSLIISDLMNVIHNIPEFLLGHIEEFDVEYLLDLIKTFDKKY